MPSSQPNSQPNSPQQTRAPKKRKASRRTPKWWLSMAALCFLCATLSKMIVNSYGLMQHQAEDVKFKRAQLGGLEGQLASGQKRLALLKGERGRELILREHGFIRPGERILLFPPRAPSPVADAPVASSIAQVQAPSLLQRSGKAMSGWWNGLRAAANRQPAPNVAPQADNVARP